MEKEWSIKKVEALMSALKKVKNGELTDFERGVLVGIAAMTDSDGNKSA